MKNTAKCSYYLFKAILVSLAAYKTALIAIYMEFRLIFTSRVWILILEGRLSGIGEHSLPGAVALSDAIRLSECGNGNHRHILVDVPNSKGRVPRHGPVDCTRRQMGAKLSVVAIGRHCSDHIGGVDVFERGEQALLLAVANDFGFEEDADVLHGGTRTGNLMFPDWSTYAPSFNFFKSRTPLPAPSATTITKCRLIFSCS